MKLKDTKLTAEQLKEKASRYMIETYERFDFVADHAKGVYLYDENDTPYLDFYAGIAVNSVGNCNEKVVEAVKTQAETLMQVFNYPYSVPQALLAEKICTLTGMDKIFYQNTGTEANEAMIKMARNYSTSRIQSSQAVSSTRIPVASITFAFKRAQASGTRTNAHTAIGAVQAMILAARNLGYGEVLTGAQRWLRSNIRHTVSSVPNTE